MRCSKTEGRKTGDLLAILAVGFFGIRFIVWPGVKTGMMPGDIGDGRFNNYILEHFFLWVTGRTHSFWNAPFFYPFPWVTAFSDNHLGTAFIYSLFRITGLDREDSFRWWYILGYAANYSACVHVLRKFRLHFIAVAAGAFIFTFSLPVLAQSSHAQLDYRFGLPLAFYYFYRALERAAPCDLLLCFFWVTWQFYAGIYTGVFLAMFLVAFWLGFVAINVPSRIWDGDSLPDIFIWPFVGLWKNTANRRWLLAMGFLILLAGMVQLLYPYYCVTKVYGFARPWDVVSLMLPRPESYLLSINSRLWSHDWHIFDNLPIKYEHGMFAGASVLLLFFVAIGGIASGWGGSRRKTLLFPLLATVVLLVVLTLHAFGMEAYKHIFDLPGFNAIRAVTRIILALLLPVSFVCAFGVHSLIELSGKKNPPRRFIAIKVAVVVMMTALVCEATYIRQFCSEKAYWRKRTKELQVSIDHLHLPSNPRPVIFVPPSGSNVVFTEIDGMCVAQANGLDTLNGYSGNIPPGLKLDAGSESTANRIDAYFHFRGITDEAEINALAERVWVWNGSDFKKFRGVEFGKNAVDGVR